MKSLKNYILDSGWQGDIRDVIHCFVGGSELHGAKVEGTDDHDIYGVYVEEPGKVLGIDAMSHSHQHYVWSTAGNDRRNSADDIDITLYSLQKWAYLASKGNCTKLHFVFSDISDSFPSAIWQDIVRNREKFLAKSHMDTFLRFAEDQFARIKGQKGRGKKGQRQELELAHGYDTKAAMHTVRILHEAEELLSTGKISLPGDFKDELIRIRKGDWTMEKLQAHVDEMKQRCLATQIRSPLPESIDRQSVSQLVAKSYLDHWRNRA